MKKVLNYAKYFLAHPAKSEINLLIFNIVAAIFPAIFMVDWYLLGLVIAADIVVCMAHGAWSYGREISFGIKEASLARQVPPWQTPITMPASRRRSFTKPGLRFCGMELEW